MLQNLQESMVSVCFNVCTRARVCLSTSFMDSSTTVLERNLEVENPTFGMSFSGSVYNCICSFCLFLGTIMLLNLGYSGPQLWRCVNFCVIFCNRGYGIAISHGFHLHIIIVIINIIMIIIITTDTAIIVMALY